MKKSRFFIHVSAVLVFSIALGAFVSCSNKLDKETLPSVTTTESFEETSETSAEETERTIGPNSTAVVTDRIVDLHGQLSVSGTDIVDANGDKIQLKGMSSYGLNACAGFFNAEIVKTIAEDWGSDVIRFAMTTKGNSDDYTSDPEKYYNLMCECVDLCIDQGIYTIIDWHILYDGDPNEYKAEAADFFSRISEKYKDCPNVFYEICNEPNGMRFDDVSQPVDWDNTIKPYAEEVIAAIRANL